MPEERAAEASQSQPLESNMPLSETEMLGLIAEMQGPGGFDILCVCCSNLSAEQFWQKRLEQTAEEASTSLALMNLHTCASWAPTRVHRWTPCPPACPLRTIPALPAPPRPLRPLRHRLTILISTSVGTTGVRLQVGRRVRARGLERRRGQRPRHPLRVREGGGYGRGASPVGVAASTNRRHGSSPMETGQNICPTPSLQVRYVRYTQ